MPTKLNQNEKSKVQKRKDLKPSTLFYLGLQLLLRPKLHLQHLLKIRNMKKLGQTEVLHLLAAPSVRQITESLNNKRTFIFALFFALKHFINPVSISLSFYLSLSLCPSILPCIFLPILPLTFYRSNWLLIKCSLDEPFKSKLSAIPRCLLSRWSV